MEKILELAKERMNHPFIGSFTVGFIMWNWRVVLYATTGSVETDNRIANIIAVTTGTGSSKDWTFVVEPLLFALLVSVIILPIGTLLLELWNHVGLVIESNIKDVITDKWDTSDDLKFRQTRDIVTVVRKKIAAIAQMAGSGNALMDVKEAYDMLEAVQQNNATSITRVWKELPKEYQT
ncbi:hypothetical protein DOM22_01150 [Bdellovibrio sp. ZAP7]|uniref:hypothetical protein n=1 Tax=Bdellovibrio sp. ZAP7 TaxID=2231053 RepID=UPI00115B921D|nr:hypothetical protein [Bdellovibrio sp. ZAP7]QDK43865.1 hypothetical protein DOM22_01150 [Bdellovibrio sp. ZAP7]